MSKTRWLVIIPLVMALVALPVFSACAPKPAAEKVVKIGSSFDLTGPYAYEDKIKLMALQDYVRYANEEKLLGDVKVEVLYGDSGSETAKAVAIYENQVAQGIVAYRTEGSKSSLAIQEKLTEAYMACPTQSPSKPLVYPPRTIFGYLPLYTDEAAVFIDWFMENWKEDRAPNFAFLSMDHPAAKAMEIPELISYAESKGAVLVGRQYIPIVPTSPPTTQLLWLKENEVDFTIGLAIHPTWEPTIKEAVRLGMGPDQPYKITFQSGHCAMIWCYAKEMGKLGDGLVVGGSWPIWDEPGWGIKLAKDLIAKYHPEIKLEEFDTVYTLGTIEGMCFIEAIKRALTEVSVEELKPIDVLNAFYSFKDFDTGGLTSSPITWGPDKCDGCDMVRLDQVQNGKQVKLGVWPSHHMH